MTESCSHDPSGAATADRTAPDRGLSIAQDLARIYHHVLNEPLPRDLQYLLRKWQGPNGLRSARASDDLREPSRGDPCSLQLSTRKTSLRVP